MGSARLPGKVLKKVSSMPMLWYMFDRLKYSQEVDKIILATSTSSKDDQLVSFAEEYQIPCFRGSEEDVLGRYYGAAIYFEGETIVRLTGDCPLIDPQVTDQVILTHLSSNADYTSNTILRTFPRGLDTEVFSFETLKKTYKEGKKNYEREHVTPYIYQHPDKFHLESVVAEKKLRRSDLRITVDTEKDLKLIRKIFEALYKENEIFHTEDIIGLLDKNPELLKINAHIKQKEVKEN